jgi:uncharacterized membrane protein YeaQ/YmgE (transglycosylase-associated protein family)
MPHGYIDPVQRVHQQQALRSLARPAQNIQQPVYQQPIQSPLAGLPQAQSEVIRASGLGQHRRPSPEATVFWGMLGALVGYLIHKNWHRAWVRGVTTFTGTFIGGWIVTFIGTAIVAALVDQNNNGTDTGPIMVWTGAASLVAASLVALAFVRRTPQRSQHRIQALGDSRQISDLK